MPSRASLMRAGSSEPQDSHATPLSVLDLLRVIPSLQHSSPMCMLLSQNKVCRNKMRSLLNMLVAVVRARRSVESLRGNLFVQARAQGGGGDRRAGQHYLRFHQ